MKVQRTLSPLLAAGLCALVLGAAAPAQAQLFTPTEMDTNWLRFSSPMGATNVDSWTPSGAFLDYTTNNGQTLASNFTVSGDYVFSTRIQPTGTDNDRLGLVFNFTDPANNYRFSWEGGGFADSTLRGLNLIRESGGASTSLFTLASTFWAANTAYDVTITRTGSDIGLLVQRVSDSAIIANTTVSDATFASGRIGLWTDSQTTRFSAVTLAIPNAAAPEPGTLALLGGVGVIGSVGIVARRRKAGPRS